MVCVAFYSPSAAAVLIFYRLFYVELAWWLGLALGLITELPTQFYWPVDPIALVNCAQ